MKKLFLTFSLLLTLLIILSFRVLPADRQVFKLYSHIFPHLPYLLGQSTPTTHLILLGNDTEMRANGGFFGSYAKATLTTSTCTMYHVPCTISSKFSFHDIYVPNGQLPARVLPPEPIQQAFGHGTWELANADFEPNFPTTATSIRWFLEKGGEINPDTLSLINLTSIKKILDVIGNFSVPEYQATLTPENLYLFLQGKAEVGFFPGSTQKADALHNVGQALIKKFHTLSLPKKIQIAKIIWQDLQNSNIVINSKEQNFQQFLTNQKWAGEYSPQNTTDFFGMVELNLGANKANAYITRQTEHIISSEKIPPVKGESPATDGEGGSNTSRYTQILHQIKITFYNHSPEANPNPPLHYGGNYIAFLRLYLPKEATNIQITHTELATNSAGINKEILTSQSPQTTTCTMNHVPYTISPVPCTIYSFWHLTLANQSSQISLSYQLPGTDHYSLLLLKQNGLVTSPQSLDIFGKKITTPLTSTFIYR